MTINDMHTAFYQYAQQMGMQNVRAILPKQVDILLNTSVSDIVNQLIRDNVGTRKDRAVVEPSKIGQTNALRPLYKNEIIKLFAINGTSVLKNNIDSLLGKITLTQNLHNYLYLIDCSIGYSKVVMHGISNNDIRNVPVRIIDIGYLNETLNDYILKPTHKSPICVMYNIGNTHIASQNPTENYSLEIYFGNSISESNDNNNNYYIIKNQLVLNELKLTYIKKPSIIDITNGDKEYLDLPASLHVDIVKHAVELYKVAISKSTYPQPSRISNPQVQQNLS